MNLRLVARLVVVIIPIMVALHGKELLANNELELHRGQAKTFFGMLCLDHDDCIALGKHVACQHDVDDVSKVCQCEDEGLIDGKCPGVATDPEDTCSRHEHCLHLYGKKSVCDNNSHRCGCKEQMVLVQEEDGSVISCEERCEFDEDCNNEKSHPKFPKIEPIRECRFMPLHTTGNATMVKVCQIAQDRRRVEENCTGGMETFRFVVIVISLIAGGSLLLLALYKCFLLCKLFCKSLTIDVSFNLTPDG